MDQWILLNNQAAGRDKLARFVQYSCRALWDSLEKKDCNPATVDQFKTLEYILSTFRKLLRFGKCLDVFYSSLRTLHYPDLAIRFTLTLSKLSQALFLFSDHIVWLARTGLFRKIDGKKWVELSNKYWLLMIVMNLARDVYEILRVLEYHRDQKLLSRPLSNLLTKRELTRISLHSYIFLQGHKDIVVDTVKNICDLFIPLTALGYTRLSPRTIGMLGAISSAAGIVSLIQPNAKLMPV